MLDLHAETRELIRSDRFAAHERLFKHRHEDETPAFHRDLIEQLWSDESRMVMLGFRGAAKSTRVEEWIALAACEGLFRNCIFVGPSETRAIERLEAVKRELRMNEDLTSLYGDLTGPVWSQSKIVLRNEIAIQAMGRDQDIRGIKHLDWRPDLVVVDDFEDKDNVQTAEGRRKTLRWFLRELLPACSPRRKIRVLATVMHAEGVPVQLIKIAKWPQRIYPIVTVGEDGEEVSIWPTRFPVSWIAEERQAYQALGEGEVWDKEFMCDLSQEGGGVFSPEFIRIEPRVRSWEAVYTMMDPARTVGPRSAMTGAVAWSWVNRRMVVWEAWARPLLPDEIVDAAFTLNERYNPVWLGIEKNGLDEWLSQPIRRRQLETGRIVPYRAVSAPRDKMAFIRGLQPYFKGGEIVWAEDFPDLRTEMGAFSASSRKDCLNALAYAPLMAPGRPIYDEFSSSLIVEDCWLDRQRTMWLALNVASPWVTGVLCQLDGGRLKIVADWVCEGDLEEAVGMVSDAQVEAGRAVRVILPSDHFSALGSSPVVSGLRREGIMVGRGVDPERGRSWLTKALQRQIRGVPVVEITRMSKWTLNALAGGYCRPLGVRSQLAADAETGPYKVLMEGLEALLGLQEVRALEEDAPHYRHTADGRRYISMLPDEGMDRPRKDQI